LLRNDLRFQQNDLFGNANEERRGRLGADEKIAICHINGTRFRN